MAKKRKYKKPLKGTGGSLGRSGGSAKKSLKGMGQLRKRRKK